MSQGAKFSMQSGRDSTSNKSTKKSKKAQANKMRIKLQPIEFFEKEVEFTAEGPGRVVVRLERLMGSDRVKLTDPKYMATLLERLEAEENGNWLVRCNARIKSERNRSKKLAIDGLMEPTSDMLEVMQHPVFRVNRVLKRLSNYDETMTLGKEVNLPPITPIDPFVYDDTGRIFKSYPGHNNLDMEELSDLGSRADIYKEILEELPSDDIKSFFELLKEIKSTEDKAEPSDSNKEIVEDSLERKSETVEEGKEQQPTSSITEKEGDEVDEESDEGGEEPTKGSFVHEDLSLTAMQKSYGIPSDEYLLRGESFRSHMVELAFSEVQENADDLFDISKEVTDVYERENMMADDFVNKTLHKLL